MLRQDTFMAGDKPVIASWRDDTQDRDCLQSCIVEDEYKIQVIRPELGDLGRGWFGIDIGAHIGGASLAMVAAGAERVIAIEPLPENLALLRANIAANGWEDRIIVIPAAVSNAGGTTEMVVADDERHRFIGVESLYDTEKSVTVQTCTLTDVFALLPQDAFVDVLKMDCEGGEWAVIGNPWSQELIGTRVGKVVCELHQHPSAGQINDLRATFAARLGPRFIDKTDALFPGEAARGPVLGLAYYERL